MGKDKTLPKFEMNQAGATAKYLRIPPRKARLVLDAVRGKYVSDAVALLKFVPNFAAEAITDVIQSAVANAENSRPMDPSTGRQGDPLIVENLKLVRAFVDEGPRIKRLQPRAQGRAYRILKRMCHITVIVEEVAPKARPIKASKAKRAAASGRTVNSTPATVAVNVVETKVVETNVEETKIVAPVEVETTKAATPVETIIEKTTPVVAEATSETEATTAEAPATE